ncbi:DeoR/GlpR family DNA-binding transcription regulator [Aquabacterium sp. OR-4]|uniref:DeoR/GlpR family DNA-binding transcription regulator n=1 Tax=Aquabacterium sp. OR-4 TaxID=2978127 RepID=UPI0021B1834E|nr:DeoR/GlpR family DNA-binding transcription regulator [Aquabacterium sp. OR-4]MDT7838894.1 DeoR/GlpR family DNA-binding transcription regulator [Aquabacterium sp. OR-4]
MTNHRRHKRLLKLLDEHGQASTEELMAWLSASAATVRRDLAWLAARQQLTRTRGGAQRLQRSSGGLLRSQTFRLDICQRSAHKRAIARHAAELCTRGETVIINGGTTTFMMAEFLVEQQLRILTNSFLLAERLLNTSNNEIILPGGRVYREQNVILSPFENDIAQHHYAAKMFMGVHGLSALGLMEADPLLVQAERRLIGQAEQLVVLADSSKFARRTGLVLCGLDRVSCVITDTEAPDAVVQWLEQQGVRVVAVAPEPLPEALACELQQGAAELADHERAVQGLARAPRGAATPARAASAASTSGSEPGSGMAEATTLSIAGAL